MATNGLNLVVGYDHDRGPTILSVVWTFTSLAIIAVAARSFSKLKLTRDIGLDDFFIILSMFFSFLFASLTTAAVAAGSGDQNFTIGPAGTLEAFRWNSIAFIPGMLALSLPTLAVTSVISKVLTPDIWQKAFMYFLSTSSVLFIALCALFLWAQCTPTAAIYNPTLNATCWPPVVLIAYSTFVGTYLAVVNLYLALYMAASLHELCITSKQKIGMTVLMTIGVVVFIIAMYICLRLPALYNSELYNSANFAYEINATSDLLIWTSVESNLTIIATCLPTLRPIYLSFLNNNPHRKRPHHHAPAPVQSFKLHSFAKGRSTRTGTTRAESFPVYEAFPVYSNDVGLLLPPQNNNLNLNIGGSGSSGSSGRRARTESTTPLIQHDDAPNNNNNIDEDGFSVYSDITTTTYGGGGGSSSRRHSRASVMERVRDGEGEGGLLRPEDAERRRRREKESESEWEYGDCEGVVGGVE
ncbi:hypothetical protein MMC14_006594 [Varicellaria rhodocarpa]|nr:hypothetical protein [Varicellaria rhodocarpa]